MDDYIKRQAAIILFQRIADDDWNKSDDTTWRRAYKEVVLLLENIPSEDVEPVRHGRWVGYPECLKYTNAYSDDHIVCSVCEECYSILDNDCERFNYCPNCGARMDGERDG